MRARRGGEANGSPDDPSSRSSEKKTKTYGVRVPSFAIVARRDLKTAQGAAVNLKLVQNARR